MQKFNLFQRFLDTIFPVKCFGCGNPNKILCEKCIQNLKSPGRACLICYVNIDFGICKECSNTYKVPSIRIYWTFHYKSAIGQIIKLLKYRFANSLADSVGNLFYKNTKNILNKLNPKETIIIPVPISDKKMRTRGFNQAKLLADYIAKPTSISLRDDILLKMKNTSSQVEVRGRAERLKNLEGSFGLKDEEEIKGKTVILVDDVLTTGATVIECSRVILKAHPKNIIALIVAH